MVFLTSLELGEGLAKLTLLLNTLVKLFQGLSFPTLCNAMQQERKVLGIYHFNL